MKLLSHSILAATCLAGATVHAQQFDLKSAFTTTTGARNGSAEIISYTKDDNFTVLSTVGDNTGGSFGVQILSLSAGGTLSEKGFADLSSVFGAAANWNGASSVAADPLERGFGAVSLIPRNSTTTGGKVAFFDYRASTPNASRQLTVVDVGFHPDSVRFSDDGTKLFVANEGEFINNNPGTTNAPGSLSIINLAGITGTTGAGGVSNVTNANVTTFDFQGANLGMGVTLAGLRNPSINAVGTAGGLNTTVPNFTTLAGSDPDFYKGIEPEYITQVGNKLHVSLQEANAIGVFDLGTNKWEKFNKLGTITQTIDGTDQDGGANINDVVKGLPMADTIASYNVGGTNYIVTANEGDARHEDIAETLDSRDYSRWGAGATTGLLDASISASPTRSNSTGFGRLRISRLDGDTDNDGDIDEAVTFGTRSFSIWNADTGALVWDSGSGNANPNDATINSLTNLETILLAADPLLFNMNNGNPGDIDTRSDDKGPEPEALTLGVIDGKTYAFIGMERQNGLLMFDITNPNAPTYVDYLNTLSNGLVSPESFYFIPGADSPNGEAFLLGGFEGPGTEAGRGIAVLAVVPEPSTALFGLALLGLAARRRSRQG